MGLANVNFVVSTPCDADTIAENIAHALSLNLPEADAAPLKRLTIVANGPSAKDAPLDGETVALNGAINLFFNTGRTPTYWAACDPQELVCDFLPANPPKDVIYFVASKCHPKLFEKLKGRDVRLWHIDDHPLPEGTRSVHCASSVTLCVMSLFRKLGYREFDTYGWDACYDVVTDGVIKHHASDQAIEQFPEETTIDLYVGATQTEDGFTGGQLFKTSRTWGAEAQDAIVQLHHADYTVNVHGDGLISAIRATLTSRQAGA